VDQARQILSRSARFEHIRTLVRVLNRTEHAACIACSIIEFKDDLSRYGSGHGAKNMAILRRFALSLVRASKSKGSIKTRRKSAGWNKDFLLEILQIK